VAPDAKAIWVHYHDHIQAHLGPNGAFRPISGFAAKAAEHSLRLAGVLTLANDLKAQDISEVEMRAGIVLSQFYLGEALRLFHTAQTNPDLLLAEKVLTWLKRAGAPALVSLPDVYQSGPNACRDKATAARILAILCDHGLTRQVEGGAVIDGKRRRVVYEVRPDV
jgi:hypothetical protein